MRLRSHYPDVPPDLNRACVFSVCDVKNGFWHVELEAGFLHLTTSLHPWDATGGCASMGMSPAPEIFQRKLNQAMEGLPGVKIIADDILIVGVGDNDEAATLDHDKNLKMRLDRCRKLNMKLQLRLKEVPYTGRLLTSEGLKVDPGKVTAIRQMPRCAGDAALPGHGQILSQVLQPHHGALRATVTANTQGPTVGVVRET